MKRKLTPQEKAARKLRRQQYMTVFMNGKQKRVPRPVMIDGMDEDTFIRKNADVIWLLQEGRYEDLFERETLSGASNGQVGADPAGDPWWFGEGTAALQEGSSQGEIESMAPFTAKVKLSALVGEMQTQPEESNVYFDRSTGGFVLVEHAWSRLLESGEPLDRCPDWQRELLELVREVLEDTEGRFVPIPERWEIHEYRIMEDYCCTLDNPRHAERLLRAIRGRGAFRRFKDTLLSFGLETEWYDFLDHALTRHAREWCAEHGLEIQEAPGGG